MGLRDDLERFLDVGEEHRMDLEEFIKHGQLGKNIQVPIKIVDLPEFVYDPYQAGGIGQAGEGQDPQVGDPVEFPSEGDEAGDEAEEPGYYDMDPEEFAEELDEELDLHLEPKGKRVVEEKLGDMVEMSRAGPRSALDIDYMFKQGLKRQLAMWYDRDWVVEACKIAEFEDVDVFRYARRNKVPVGLSDIEDIRETLDDFEYETVEEFEEANREPKHRPPARDIDSVMIRQDDERYRHPELVEEKQKNVVVLNIRDVSGSMGTEKRDLVERIFTPMDWYLQGKYENAEFRYIAHNAQAWEEDRDSFFGMESRGGTRVSTAYELAKEMLDSQYPWEEWNRYVFAAGDGDNFGTDTREKVAPLIKEIDANMHAYIEVKPRSSNVLSILQSELNEPEDYVGKTVTSRDQVIPTIEQVLREASTKERQED